MCRKGARADLCRLVCEQWAGQGMLCGCGDLRGAALSLRGYLGLYVPSCPCTGTLGSVGTAVGSLLQAESSCRKKKGFTCLY